MHDTSQMQIKHSVVFLYTNNKKYTKEIAFKIASKRKKIFRNKLNQCGKNLVHWNLQMLLKETKEDFNKWKDILYS